MAGSIHIWAGKPDNEKDAQHSKPDGASGIAPLFLWGIGLVAIGLLVVWLSTAAAILTLQNKSVVTARYPTFMANNSEQHYTVNVSGEPSIGPENAPVTIVEFGDFECSFCKRFFADVEPALLKKYAGKIRFIYRDYPMTDMHPYAEIAAEAAHCAEDQHKFWEYHNLLFQSEPLPNKAALITYATQLNLDTSAFENCLNSSKHGEHIQATRSEGLTLGITGTPTFFINGQKLEGAQPLSAFSAIIDADLSALVHE